MTEIESKIHIIEKGGFGILSQIIREKRSEPKGFQLEMDISTAEWEGMGTSIKSYGILRESKPFYLL